jgi:hypothetical protein
MLLKKSLVESVDLLKTRFCLECENFEDRGEIDGNVVCAENHRPGISCEDFKDRLSDIFYSYVYWAHRYNAGGTDQGVEDFEKRFHRKLSDEELAYACFLNYFELGLDDSHFYRCWNIVRKNYSDKLPVISKILDAALDRFNLYEERTNMKRVFEDLLSQKTKPAEALKQILKGDYKRGVS